MSAAETVEERRERLRAGVTALRQKIADCSGRLETLRSSRAKPPRTPQWESSDSDVEVEGEGAPEDTERVRAAVLALRTRLLATRELCALTVERSECQDLAGCPDVLTRDVSATAAATPGGRWREVSAQCRFQSVPFEMAFVVLENDKGVLAYRNLSVEAMKPRQRLELASSSLGACATPSDASDCLRAYSAACRVRRDTLQTLAERYEQIEIRPSDEGGGYRLTCVDVLRVEWRLQGAASPLLPFRHRILIELEYVTDDRYLEDIKKIHNHLREPEISKTDRTRLFRKLIDISLHMYEDHRVTETTEFDMETARRLNTSRRMTLDYHNDVIDDEMTSRNTVKGKRDQFKNSKTKPTDPRMVSEETRKVNKDEDINTKNKKVKERIEQGTNRMDIEKNKKKQRVDKLTEEVENIQINDKNTKQNSQREEICGYDEQDNIFELRDPKNLITKNKSQGKPEDFEGRAEDKTTSGNNKDVKRPNHNQAEIIKGIGHSQAEKKKPQAIKENNLLDKVKIIQNKKHSENENNVIKVSKKILNKVHNEDKIKENNVQKVSEKNSEEVLSRKSGKNKIIDKENILLNSSREIITGITKNANKHSVRDNLFDLNAGRETLPGKISETESKSSQHSITKPIFSKNSVPKQISSKDSVPIKISSKNSVPNQLSSKNSVSNQITSKKFAPNQISGKNDFPEKVSNKGSVSEKISSKNGVEIPENIYTKSSFPEKALSKKSVREKMSNDAFEEQVSEVTSTQEKISALPQKKSKVNKMADTALPRTTLGKNIAAEKIAKKYVGKALKKNSNENASPDEVSQKMVVKEIKVNKNRPKEKVLSHNSPKKKHFGQGNMKDKLGQDNNTDNYKTAPKVDGIASTNLTKMNTQGAKNLKRVKSADSVVASKKLKNAESDKNPSVNPEKEKVPMAKASGSAIPKVNLKIAGSGVDKRKMVTGQEKVPTKIPKKVSTFFFGHQVPSRQSPRTAKKSFGMIKTPFFQNRV